MTKAPAPTISKSPFALGVMQAARTLIRTHQRLRGELLKHQDGEDALVPADECLQRMAEFEAVLRFFDVGFDPQKLKAHRERPKISPLGYGEVRAGVLEALKRAGDWQTYNQLADAMVQRHGIALAPAQRKHFLQKLREATHALKKAGAVVCCPGSPGSRLAAVLARRHLADPTNEAAPALVLAVELLWHSRLDGARRRPPEPLGHAVLAYFHATASPSGSAAGLGVVPDFLQ